MLHKKILFSCAFFSAFPTKAQQTDTLPNERFSFHFQNTIIKQYKPAFKAAYSGSNSLIPHEETQTSITSTIFAGVKLWKGGSLFINPELPGGAALSQAFGVADATNGENFRVGDPASSIFLAREFYRQLFPLSSNQTISGGISSAGNKWNRPNDNVGLPYVASGICRHRRNYLKNGGKGFELGDGNLNYGLEQITE